MGLLAKGPFAGGSIHVRTRRYLLINKKPEGAGGREARTRRRGRLEGATMYEPSRQISSFYIAGFQYWDGALVLSELKVGERLRLVPEFDNPHDPSAMAIYRGKTKMGFVPGSENELLALMFFYGHSDGFELRVLQVSPDQKPWEQVRVGLYVTDAR